MTNRIYYNTIWFIILFILVFINNLWLIKLNDKMDNSQIYEYPKAINPTTGADSVLINRCNFFVEENIRLENYIIHLEQENQIFGSMLAQKE